MQNLERRKRYGFYCPLWADLTREQILSSTDADIAKWEADFPIMSAHNRPIADKIRTAYETVLSNAEIVWGKTSNEYKYIKKSKPYNFDVEFALRPELQLARLKTDILEYRKKQEHERQQLNSAKNKERQKQEALVKRTEICIRRGFEMDMVFDVFGMRELLLAQDKYLNLAHAMQETRNDWSEGFYRVRTALNTFVVETDIDKLIAEDIRARLNSDETDGRIFRDTTWNYDRLFGLVSDKTLIADLESLED